MLVKEAADGTRPLQEWMLTYYQMKPQQQSSEIFRWMYHFFCQEITFEMSFEYMDPDDKEQTVLASPVTQYGLDTSLGNAIVEKRQSYDSPKWDFLYW